MPEAMLPAGMIGLCSERGRSERVTTSLMVPLGCTRRDRCVVGVETTWMYRG